MDGGTSLRSLASAAQPLRLPCNPPGNDSIAVPTLFVLLRGVPVQTVQRMALQQFLIQPRYDLEQTFPLREEAVIRLKI
jgi:hypothetical protein